MTPTPVRHVRIPDDEWEAAKVAAAARGEDVSKVVRRLLREYVETDSASLARDYFDAQARAARVRGRATLPEVLREYVEEGT